MPKFKSNVILANKGRIAFPGDEVTLTEEQAENLGAKVSRMSEEGEVLAKQTHDETSFKALSAKEQKAIVQELGGDLEEHTNADARWAYFEGQQ